MSINEKSARLKRVVEALEARHQSGLAGETEQVMHLLDPTYELKAENDEGAPRREFCHVGIKAKNVLTSAHITYIMPPGQRWFTLLPRDKKRPHELTAERSWYEKASEITATELGDSNFYLDIQETFNDRCGPGTGCMFIGGDETHPLHFKHIPYGTYKIAEDEKGLVNTIARRFYYTAEQAAEEWGLDALPPKARDDYEDPAKRYTEKRQYIHCVLPRPNGRTESELLPEDQRAFEGYYCDAEYNIIKEEGWYEFPYFVTRFSKGNDSPYGVAPGHIVVSTMRRLIRLERIMDALGEQAAFPPMVQLASQNKQIDMRAGAISTISPEEAQMQMPRPLAVGGSYDVGKDRIQECKNDINEAFYVDMLLSISNVDRDMTATEVEERVNEKVLAFSPSFVRLIYEFRPAMHRIISVLFRRNAYPKQDMPKDMFMKSADGKVRVLNPNVSYTGRIAQAVEKVMQRGMDLVIQKVVQYTQATGDTSMVERLNPPAVLSHWTEAAGAPDDILKEEAKYEEEQAAKQAQLMQQQQMMLEMHQAEMNQKNADAQAKLNNKR